MKHSPENYSFLGLFRGEFPGFRLERSISKDSLKKHVVKENELLSLCSGRSLYPAKVYLLHVWGKMLVLYVSNVTYTVESINTKVDIISLLDGIVAEARGKLSHNVG